MLLSRLLYRERVAGRQAAGVLLCLLGASWIVLQGDLRTLASLSFVQGDLLMVIAVLCYGLYSVLLRRRPSIHTDASAREAGADARSILAPPGKRPEERRPRKT